MHNFFQKLWVSDYKTAIVRWELTSILREKKQTTLSTLNILQYSLQWTECCNFFRRVIWFCDPLYRWLLRYTSLTTNSLLCWLPTVNVVCVGAYPIEDQCWAQWLSTTARYTRSSKYLIMDLKAKQNTNMNAKRKQKHNDECLAHWLLRTAR